MYFAEYYNHRIRKVTVLTGIITTIAGTGAEGFSGDEGDAMSATLHGPNGIGLDASGIYLYVPLCFICSLPCLGNVYITDFHNHRVRKVTLSTGIIDTIAGNGAGDFSGDGGQAKSAALNYPAGVALDPSGITASY